MKELVKGVAEAVTAPITLADEIVTKTGQKVTDFGKPVKHQ